MKTGKLIGVAGVVLCFFLSGYIPPPSLPSPPIHIPIAVHKAGSKAETTFLIREDSRYFFALEYLYRSDDLNVRNYIRELAGTGQSDATGRYINTGIPVYLNFKLVQINSETGTEKILQHQELSEHPVFSMGHESLDKRIAIVPLTAGYYRVSVENLREVPELSGIAANLKLIEHRRK